MGTAIDPIPWKSINGTKGISSVVSLDGLFRPINANIIRGLQKRCDKHGIFQTLSDIGVGDRAKIEKGPFADFICTIDQIKDSRRAWVLIDLLHRQVKALVSVGDIAKNG